jgi:Acyl-CoA dehydrogenase, C-terminal domain
MNLELPDGTIELAAVISRALAAEGADLFGTLDGLGVLDLAGAESADPDNAHVNVVVALEEIARAGRRAPVAETIWARARGLDTGAGFVAAACDERAGDDRLVPCGSFADSLLAGPAAAPTVVPMPESARPARIEIDPGHLWLSASLEAPSLAALDAAYAWRAAAAGTVGAMSKATDMAIGHARNRVQFGKPLASFQALQFRLAECHWRLLGLRLLVREAAWRADRHDPRADAVSALAWLYAREVGRIVTKHVHQVHGAIGFTRELGLTTLTGSVATLRSTHPARPAVAVVKSSRCWDGAVPPSTVLGGFG